VLTGAGGTTNSASRDSSRAITSGKALGRGARSAVALVGAGPVAAIALDAGFSLGVLRDAFRRAAPVATFGFGLAFALEVLREAFAGEAPVAAFGFGPAFAFGVLLDLLAGADRACRASGDLNVTTAGRSATACSVNAAANGGAVEALADSGSATFDEVSTTRRSGTATRLSCQGKAKPGNPDSWLPKVRLNNRAWNSRESSSEVERRLPWPGSEPFLL